MKALHTEHLAQTNIILVFPVYDLSTWLRTASLLVKMAALDFISQLQGLDLRLKLFGNAVTCRVHPTESGFRVTIVVGRVHCQEDAVFTDQQMYLVRDKVCYCVSAVEMSSVGAAKLGATTKEKVRSDTETELENCIIERPQVEFAIRMLLMTFAVLPSDLKNIMDAFVV